MVPARQARRVAGSWVRERIDLWEGGAAGGCSNPRREERAMRRICDVCGVRPAVDPAGRAARVQGTDRATSAGLSQNLRASIWETQASQVQWTGFRSALWPLSRMPAGMLQVLDQGLTSRERTTEGVIYRLGARESGPVVDSQSFGRHGVVDSPSRPMEAARGEVPEALLLLDRSSNRIP